MHIPMPNRISLKFAEIFFMTVFIYSLSAFSVCAQDLDQTFKSVYRDNPTLQAARHELEAVRERYPQAAAGWKPRVDGEASLTSTHIESGNFSSGDGATTKSASASIEQPLFHGFRTVSEMKSAEQGILAAEKNLLEREQSIFLNTARAYVAVLRGREMVALEQKNRDLHAAERDAVQARFEAGDLTQTDVQQTKARYADALARLAAAESALGEENAVFEELTGFTPPDDMPMPTPSFSFPDTEEGLTAMAASANPTMAAVRYEHLAAESDIGAVRSGLYPQIAAFASYIKEYDPQPGIIDESETGTIGVRARITLYEGGANLSRIRQARAIANQRSVQVLETDMAVQRMILANWRKYNSYDAEIAARELEADAARFSAEGVREEARLGERSVFDVLEAEREVLDAETALIDAKAQRVVTSYTLAGALGWLSAERLGVDRDQTVLTVAEVSAPVESPVIAPVPAVEAVPVLERDGVTVYQLD